MNKDTILICIIALILGFLVAGIIRGNGFDIIDDPDDDYTKCNLKLQELCGHTTHNVRECNVCVGTHQSDLNKAGCMSSKISITNFCTMDRPPPKLDDNTCILKDAIVEPEDPNNPNDINLNLYTMYNSSDFFDNENPRCKLKCKDCGGCFPFNFFDRGGCTCVKDDYEYDKNGAVITKRQVPDKIPRVCDNSI